MQIRFSEGLRTGAAARAKRNFVKDLLSELNPLDTGPLVALINRNDPNHASVGVLDVYYCERHKRIRFVANTILATSNTEFWDFPEVSLLQKPDARKHWYSIGENNGVKWKSPFLEPNQRK